MKDNKGNKFKKQIVSGGIYIALAAAVVTVTLNGVNNIIGSSEDYEIPEINFTVPENTNKALNDFLNFGTDDEKANKQMGKPADDESEKNEIRDSKNETNNVTEQHSADSMQQSSNPARGISSEIISNDGDDKNESDILVSGEPEDVEYPTEPDPVYYEVYAKPADGYIDREYTDDELLYSVTMGDYRTHNGVDITGDLGSAVRSINAGVIEDIYYDAFYGHTVKINHGNQIVAYYMNLSESFPADISVGKTVSHGQVIGGIGNTAPIECAEVSHLHLSITVNGEFVDPREFLRNQY